MYNSCVPVSISMKGLTVVPYFSQNSITHWLILDKRRSISLAFFHSFFHSGAWWFCSLRSYELKSAVLSLKLDQLNHSTIDGCIIRSFFSDYPTALNRILNSTKQYWLDKPVEIWLKTKHFDGLLDNITSIWEGSPSTFVGATTTINYTTYISVLKSFL